MRTYWTVLALVIALTGCHDHMPSENADATSTDTTAQCKGGLYDSIHDARLRSETCLDGIELLAVQHATIEKRPVEQILYLDHSSERLHLYKITEQGFGPMEFDSTVLRHNPLPAMNGNYVKVFKYKGQYVIANIGDETTSEQLVVTDSAIIWIPNGFNALLYKSGERSGDRVTYIVADQQQHRIDTIHIRLLDRDSNLQLWHWPHEFGSSYVLMMPFEKLGTIPVLNAINNLNLDGNMDVTLDQIDYDSLMHH